MPLPRSIPAGLAVSALLALAARGAAPIPAVVPTEFLPQIREQLATHFRLEGELQLDLLRTWAPPRTPTVAWEMRVITPPAALAPQNIVRVRLVADQRSLGEWNLPLRAQLWGDALVARQPVARGVVLNLSLFDLRRTDFLREKDAVPAQATLDSLTVARGIAAGAVLGWRDIVRRPLVQRGDRIEVVASDGPLTITMKGLALQSGALGETILVRNPESRRDFTAVVTAESRARVAF